MKHELSRLSKKGLLKLEFKLLKTLVHYEKTINLIGAKILLNVMVSGGRDSMCLLYSVNRAIHFEKSGLRNKYKIIVTHVNHQKRGDESDGDEELVRKTCASLNLKFYGYKFFPDVCDNENFHATARKFRRLKAIEACEIEKTEYTYNAYFIFTAHHLRDHVETFLFNLARGCGPEGLFGFAKDAPNELKLLPWAKPLWDASWEDIEEYSKQNDVPYRVDSSNLETNYTRNFIRNDILQMFKRINPNFESAIFNLSHLLYQQRARNLETQETLFVDDTTNSTDIFNFLKSNLNLEDGSIKASSINNIKDQCNSFINGPKAEKTKKIPLKKGVTLRLEKQSQ